MVQICVKHEVGIGALGEAVDTMTMNDSFDLFLNHRHRADEAVVLSGVVESHEFPNLPSTAEHRRPTNCR